MFPNRQIFLVFLEHFPLPRAGECRKDTGISRSHRKNYARVIVHILILSSASFRSFLGCCGAGVVDRIYSAEVDDNSQQRRLKTGEEPTSPQSLFLQNDEVIGRFILKCTMQ
jgi:hypothetical protein